MGDLYFDTTANELKVYKSSGWAAAGSSVNGTSARFTYTASGGQTTFTGNDNNSQNLTYDSPFIDVYLNGVKLVNGTDVTVTSGSSVVLASGATAGDTLDLVAFGTFNVAALNADNITSGTVDNARLPSVISDKTIQATALTAKGDGSSADGKITLNCSQNSHGVAIQSPAHSAGQSYTLILPTSVGTNGQVLATSGSSTNQLSWVTATETKPTVADVSQTIAPATATTITITGTNFVSIPQVDFVNGSTGAVTRANTVSFTNATPLSVNCTLATGNYYVRIENPDGNAGRSTNNIITASTAPTFTTNAGSLGSFAGNFSGPLFTIQGYILTLIEGALKDKKVRGKYLRRSAKGVDRLISIVKDLDLITQFESGIKTVDKTDFNIYELIENVYDLMEFESEKNNTKLLVNNENNTPVIVNADKERILQVLTNLVVNSIKYGKEGGYTKVKVEEYDKDRIIVRVKDNGEGIEDEHLPGLFERFYRIDKNRSRKKGGSGLGLSIVKHIIEAHQEQIFVDSKIGQGTEFSFTLQKP